MYDMEMYIVQVVQEYSMYIQVNVENRIWGAYEGFPKEIILIYI